MKDLHVIKLPMYTITSITTFLGYVFQDTHMLCTHHLHLVTKNIFSYEIFDNKNMREVKKRQHEYPKFGHT